MHAAWQSEAGLGPGLRRTPYTKTEFFIWQQEGEFDEFFDVSDDFSGSDVCDGAAVYGYVPAVASGVVLLFFHFHIDDADDFDDDDDRHGPGADFWRAGQ